MQSIKFLTKQTISSFYSAKQPLINKFYQKPIEYVYSHKGVRGRNKSRWNNLVNKLVIDLRENIESELALEDDFEIGIKLVFEKLNLLIRDKGTCSVFCIA